MRNRQLWQGEEREQFETLLADLDPSRYVSVVRMSKALGRTEQEMSARLELAVAWYREQAVRAATSCPNNYAADVDTNVRRAATVMEAQQRLRRRNPNRPLMAEALALRLARP